VFFKKRKVYIKDPFDNTVVGPAEARVNRHEKLKVIESDADHEDRGGLSLLEEDRILTKLETCFGEQTLYKKLRDPTPNKQLRASNFLRVVIAVITGYFVLSMCKMSLAQKNLTIAHLVLPLLIGIVSLAVVVIFVLYGWYKWLTPKNRIAIRKFLYELDIAIRFFLKR